MPEMKTPGVYVVEKSAFPNSVVQVATAVPAFIGYTEFARNGKQSLTNKPWKISSYAEYLQYFGADPKFVFSLEEAISPAELSFNNHNYSLKQTTGRLFLSRNLRMFFQNGGGQCYIVSVGNYQDETGQQTSLDPTSLINAIKLLRKEQEPTMLVIPDAVLLDTKACAKVQKSMLKHCGQKMRNRIAILDIFNGHQAMQEQDNCVADFRAQLVSIDKQTLSYGVAYYPWLRSNIISDAQLNIGSIDSGLLLKKLIKEELVEKNLQETLSSDLLKSLLADLQKVWPEPLEKMAKKKVETSHEEKKTPQLSDEELAQIKKLLHKALLIHSSFYHDLFQTISKELNLLPPSASMAGVYTAIDNSRGVWKAPANVSINAVHSPSVTISTEDQEGLNVNIQGLSINAIRNVAGEGTLVWGARTLNGNSLDWRYINVRRTMIMLEESIRLATKAYVFEPNEQNTWLMIKNILENFLTQVWKQGGLAGSSPDDAFSVRIGLGETMTGNDILEGILRISVLVAITRPAEFIEILFQQKMQKS